MRPWEFCFSILIDPQSGLSSVSFICFYINVYLSSGRVHPTIRPCATLGSGGFESTHTHTPLSFQNYVRFRKVKYHLVNI